MPEPETYNLFVVRTPLQLFNAIEARERFHGNESNLLLVCEGSTRDAGLLQGMLDDRWTDIHVVSCRGVWRSLYAWRLRSWLAALPPLQTAYIGLVRQLPLHVVNTVRPVQLRILDDGNETLLISRSMAGSGKTAWTPRLREKLTGRRLDPAILARAVFFTVYDVSSSGFDSIRNDYRVFRSNARALPERNTLLFIGSNIMGHCLRDEDVLRHVLEHTRQQYPDLEYLYCPHRYEPVGLRPLIEACGYRLFTPDCILEMALATAGWRPALIVSVRSTAVDTLGVLYGVRGCLLETAREDVVSEMAYAELQAVWQAWRASGGATMVVGPSIAG